MSKPKKIRLEFVKETFSYDEEKRTTKCTLVFRPHFREFAQTYGRPIDEVLEKSPKKYKQLLKALSEDEFVVTGVASCSNGDKFNKEVGAKIAKHRARYRAEKKYNHCLRAYIECLQDTTLLCLLNALVKSERSLELYKDDEFYYANEF